MLSNMAASLILHKRITTTTAKAKALRTFVEPLINRSKDDSTHSRRVVFSYLQDKEAVTELFREISVKVAERPGGYTRILKINNRLGDNAEMCIIELVDYNDNLLAAKDDKGQAAKRKRRGTKKKGSAEVVSTPVVEAKTDKKAEVVEVAEETVEEVKASSEEVVENEAQESAGEEEDTDEKDSEEKTKE
jgi:large subunit ribosomal protein L17